VSGEERPEDVLVTALDGGIVDAMAGEALMLEMSSRTADFREGLRAFSERRPARFEGR
jgi:2-(1,2-epoxy-1,2-dihydrophenyl)acetyl-CoA isomerase